MLEITLICVGKLKEAYWRDACREYAKRMSRYARFSIAEVQEERLPEDPSPAQIQHTLTAEGKRILSRIPAGARIIAMCIEGKEYTSVEMAQMLQKAAVSGSSSVAFIIGGSYGLSEEVKQKASLRFSMSVMTFPHQLARVMLCEQVYRAFQISSGGKYHK